MSDFSEYLETLWSYNEQSLIDTVCSFFDTQDDFLCRNLINVDNRIFLITNDDKKADEFINNAIKQINETINLRLEIIETRQFNSIFEIAISNILIEQEKGKMLFGINITTESIEEVSLHDCWQ